MDLIQSFLAWAWERHHNPLSWYIRPLFLLPYCYFAYRRSPGGMIASVVALASSMFWFPKPEHVDPQAVAFLEMERQYLTGPWTPLKLLIGALVPLMFFLLGLAFWKRSWLFGALVINLGALTKIVWSFYFGNETAWTLVPAAVLGMVICNTALYLAYRFTRRELRMDSSPGG